MDERETIIELALGWIEADRPATWTRYSEFMETLKHTVHSALGNEKVLEALKNRNK